MIFKDFENRFEIHLRKHSNSPCHSANLTKAWFVTNEVDYFKWPPCRPDMSPIEDLWAIISQRMKKGTIPTFKVDWKRLSS